MTSDAFVYREVSPQLRPSFVFWHEMTHSFTDFFLTTFSNNFRVFLECRSLFWIVQWFSVMVFLFWRFIVTRCHFWGRWFSFDKKCMERNDLVAMNWNWIKILRYFCSCHLLCDWLVRSVKLITSIRVNVLLKFIKVVFSFRNGGFWWYKNLSIYYLPKYAYISTRIKSIRTNTTSNGTTVPSPGTYLQVIQTFDFFKYLFHRLPINCIFFLSFLSSDKNKKVREAPVSG